MVQEAENDPESWPEWKEPPEWATNLLIALGIFLGGLYIAHIGGLF